MSPPESTPALDVEAAVRERYSDAARAAEPALCCPTSYDPRLLEAIPEEGLRGEIVVVMAPGGAEVADDGAVRAALAERAGRMSLRDAAAEVAAAVGRPRKDVYRMALAMQEERDDDDHALD